MKLVERYKEAMLALQRALEALAGSFVGLELARERAKRLPSREASQIVSDAAREHRGAEAQLDELIERIVGLLIEIRKEEQHAATTSPRSSETETDTDEGSSLV